MYMKILLLIKPINEIRLKFKFYYLISNTILITHMILN